MPDLFWRAGTPARLVLVAAIRVYRAVLSGWLGGQCRFSPTCSYYAEAAVRDHGAVKGSAMTVWRVARCNPYGAGGIDPVPPGRRSRAASYDAISRRGEGVHL